MAGGAPVHGAVKQVGRGGGAAGMHDLEVIKIQMQDGENKICFGKKDDWGKNVFLGKK